MNALHVLAKGHEGVLYILGPERNVTLARNKMCVISSGFCIITYLNLQKQAAYN